MWSRILDWLACPVCHNHLQLESFEESHIELAPEHLLLAKQRDLLDDDFNRYITSGVLLCNRCRGLYPIMHGLPVLVPYATPIHTEFASTFAGRLSEFATYRPPTLEAVPGEQFVMNSFSSEWIGYSYDGVIWDLTYEDHEKRFLAEIGPAAATHGRGGLFVEIGCGIGLTSFFASKNLQCDAIGVDLSLAVLRASQHFKTDPFLHFVQGSAFYLPIRRSLASVMYSHGVLHHTYSTAKAVASVAQHCQEDGWLYLWLYGSGSKKGSPARRIAYMLEETLRPVIARNLASLPSRAALAAMAYAYRLVNAFHRFRDPSVEKYDYDKALHAARDRFTPLYAHRQDFAEVASWLTALGFEDVEEVDWRTMPTANQDNYRRNTGVRGKRARA
ncbi:MAG: methyltransferase domain-containing protein [Gemmatimonadota bacterium]|nr:methyltransferase domain-containing protein [Gemmatimonadota bacterium]